MESLNNNNQMVDRENNNNNDLNNLMPGASDNYEDEDEMIEEHIVAGSVGIPIAQGIHNELDILNIEGNGMIPHGQVPVA